jgi:glucose-6-phosphate 1-epimerase
MPTLFLIISKIHFSDNYIFLLFRRQVDGAEMLYLSSKSAMDGSKAVRGGIPICFPNFGPWKFGAQHGFARTSNDWKVHHPPQVDGDTGDVKVI